jgi:hypothetical protein
VGGNASSSVAGEDSAHLELYRGSSSKVNWKISNEADFRIYKNYDGTDYGEYSAYLKIDRYTGSTILYPKAASDTQGSSGLVIDTQSHGEHEGPAIELVRGGITGA